MMPMNWSEQLASYIKTPRFVSYGAASETRPVLVDCSLGINPLDLYADLSVTLSAREFGGYPQDGHGIRTLGEYVHSRFPSVKPDDLCFGAGSQGTICSLSRILGGPDVRVLGIVPTFISGLMEFCNAGCTVETVELSPPYRIDVDLIISALKPDTTLVYLDNPNNPTGQVLSLAAVDRLAKACFTNGTLLFVDEAYADFVDDANSAFTLPYPNIICSRSFSKGCGLAGARIGYILLKDPALREYYRQMGLLFSASTVAAAFAAQVLPALNLPAIRTGVRALKKEVLGFIADYPDFSVAASSDDTPIFFLLWKKTEGDLFEVLIDAGIYTEAGSYFAVKGDNAVRLRVPSAKQLDEFKSLWRKAFG